MRRLLAALVAVAVLAPLGAEAQRPPKTARLGVLMFGTPTTDGALAAFREGLREVGYIEGRTVALEYRYADGRPERLPELARELAALRPDVIVALGGDVAPAAKAATASIPIVVAVSVDPVQSGLVGGLARPGGNVTGVTFVASDLAAKRLQLLKEVAPTVTRVGVLWNTAHPDFEYKETLAAGRRIGVDVQSLEIGTPADFEAAFRAAAAARVQAVVVASSRQMLLNRQHIAEQAARHRMILVSGWGPFAQSGALLSYGPDVEAAVRRTAIHVDKILKGARPGELPFEQPTKFELVLNLKTATAHGLTLSPAILARADKVIQ